MPTTGKTTGIKGFLTKDIWKIRIDDYTGFKRFVLKYLRIFLIAGEQFIRDNCILWGSSLTYYSLLSIVPVLALGFAIAKGFGLQKYLEDLILQQFTGQEEVIMRVLTFSHNLLERTSGGIIAGVGVVFLLWSVFQILSNAELAFNNIWDVKKGRSIGRKMSDYLSIMLVSPVLLVVSSSAMVLLATRINELMAAIGLGFVAPLVALLLGIVPYILIWLLLTFIYIFLPNTKVKYSSAFIGGILAGTSFVIIQWIYIKFQVGVAGYNAIYGSFAALPLFLIWLNTSWLIVLFGTEIVYAHQNVHIYEYEHTAENLSHSFKTLLTLQVAHKLVMNFKQGGSPMRVSELSKSLEMSRRILIEILTDLSKANLIIGIPLGSEERKAYQPSRDIDFFTIASVIEAVESIGVGDLPVARTESSLRISKSLETFKSLIEHSDANVKLKDI